MENIHRQSAPYSMGSGLAGGFLQYMMSSRIPILTISPPSLGAVDKSILIHDNEELVSLEGLRSLSRIGNSLSVSGNPSLTSLADLSRLKAVSDSLEIYRNESLRSLLQPAPACSRTRRMIMG